MNRKERRAAAARRRKGDPEQAMTDKIAMFGKLPKKCSACEKSFDKTDREMVFSWKVVVKEKEQVVRLFCPDCHDIATKVVNNAD